MRIDFVGGAVVQFVVELKSLDDRPTESDYSLAPVSVLGPQASLT